MMEPALIEYLKSNAQVSAAVSGRIYPGHLPDPMVLPAISYQRISTSRPVAYDGPVGWVESRLQLTVWGETLGAVREGARALRLALLGYSGRMGVRQIAIPRQPTDFDLFDEDTKLFGAVTEFTVWYDEEITP